MLTRLRMVIHQVFLVGLTYTDCIFKLEVIVLLLFTMKLMYGLLKCNLRSCHALNLSIYHEPGDVICF